MGWQDAPPVEGSPLQPTWMSAPAVATTAPAPAAAPPVAPDAAPPAPGYVNDVLAPVSKGLQKTIGNVPGSVANLVGGVAHAVAHPIDTAGNVVKAFTGAVDKYTPQWYKDFTDKIWAGDPAFRAKSREMYDQLEKIYADRYGSKDGFRKAVTEDPAGIAADLSMMLGGASTIASRIGATSKAEALAAASRAANPLTPVVNATAAAVKPIVAGVSAVARPLAIGAKNNFLLQSAEGRGPQIVNALRDPNGVIIPGSKPTVGEMAAPAGSTRLAAEQETARRAVATTAYFDRDDANRVAQQAALDIVAGKPGALESAVDARKAAATAEYTAAGKKVVNSDAALQGILSTPAGKAAVTEAARVAANEEKPFTIGQNLPERTIPSAILDTSGAPIRSTTIPAQTERFSVDNLHRVKMALDDMIKNPETSGIGKTEAGSVARVRKQLLSWLDKNAPDYAAARKNFAEASVLINQMQVGQFLKERLAAPLGNDSRPQMFATAMDSAATTIKRATGQRRYDDLSKMLTPEQMMAVESVRADIAREDLYARQATAGAGAGTSLKGPASELTAAATGGVGMPSMMSRIAMAANAIMRRVQGKLDRKIAIELAADMLDPAKYANNLEGAMARQDAVQRIGQAFRNGGAGTVNALKNPALLAAGQVNNALAQ